MSAWTEFRAVWRGLSDEQKAQVPDALRRFFAGGPAELAPDEFFEQAMEQGRVMMSDAFNNMAHDMTYAVLERMQRTEGRLAELEPELERLKGLAGEWNDPARPIKGFFLEHCIAFWQAAEKRYASHGDVDAQQWAQYRLNPDWEIKDFFAQPGGPEYSGSDIRAMLVQHGYRPEAIHIDDAKIFKMPVSPGGGGPSANWGNAYYYKAMYHYVGVESVAITDKGTIIGIEERQRTAGAAGVVARFLRPYFADPGDVLPREWNNAIIWPEAGDYTEIRF